MTDCQRMNKAAMNFVAQAGKKSHDSAMFENGNTLENGKGLKGLKYGEHYNFMLLLVGARKANFVIQLNKAI